MVLSVTGLEFIEDIVSFNNLKELMSNNFLKDFGNRWEFANWTYNYIKPNTTKR